MIALWFFFLVAMDEMLRYVARRSIGIILKMVSVKADFVAGILTVTFVPYYAVDGVVLGWFGLTAISLLLVRCVAMLGGLELRRSIDLGSVRC